MATVTRPRPKSAKPARRKLRPTFETELFLCIGFEADGSPFVYSSETELDLLEYPTRGNTPGGFRIVRSTVAISIPEPPTVSISAVKGGAK